MNLVDEYNKIVSSNPSRAGELGTNDVAEMSVRNLRDSLLKESDWTQNRDINLSNDSEWVTYRQALRDLPTQSGWPLDVTWPTKPG
jgi:hypothetical protein